MKLSYTLLAALAALPLWASSPAVAGDSESSIVALFETSAETPSAHEALARFYDERALQQRAAAKRMRDAARRRVGKLGASSWSRAAADPGRDNDAAAVRYESLARMHREQAQSLIQRSS